MVILSKQYYTQRCGFSYTYWIMTFFNMFRRILIIYEKITIWTDNCAYKNSQVCLKYARNLLHFNIRFFMKMLKLSMEIFCICSWLQLRVFFKNTLHPLFFICTFYFFKYFIVAVLQTLRLLKRMWFGTAVTPLLL